MFNFFLFPERDHSDMNKDPFFKDFKRYMVSKIRLDKAKEKMKDCCGPSVVKTVDGQGNFCCLRTNSKDFFLIKTCLLTYHKVFLGKRNSDLLRKSYNILKCGGVTCIDDLIDNCTRNNPVYL